VDTSGSPILVLLLVADIGVSVTSVVVSYITAASVTSCVGGGSVIVVFDNELNSNNARQLHAICVSTFNSFFIALGSAISMLTLPEQTMKQ